MSGVVGMCVGDVAGVGDVVVVGSDVYGCVVVVGCDGVDVSVDGVDVLGVLCWSL